MFIYDGFHMNIWGHCFPSYSALIMQIFLKMIISRKITSMVGKEISSYSKFWWGECPVTHMRCLLSLQLVVAVSHSSSLFPSGYAHGPGPVSFSLKNRAVSFLLHAMNVHHSWTGIKWTLKVPFLRRAHGTWQMLWSIMNFCCNWPSRMKKTDNLVPLVLALRSHWDLFGWDFPGGPVAKTLCSQCRGPPWSGNWIPHTRS